MPIPDDLRQDAVFNLDNHELSVHHVTDAQRCLWASHKDGKTQIGLCNALTQKVVDAALDAYDGRNPPITGIHTRWGNIFFREEPSMPDGVLLLIPAKDYPDWERAMKDAVAIVNIGTGRV